MALTIGSNIASLRSQRRLSEGTSQLSKTYERLSSGQRINKAADDAAGLAISESLKSDRRVFNQGVRNFNDGISLLNIADGAIENLSGIVIRLKELAEQSANGTYSSTQRAAIDKEAQALSKEYMRIALSTKFNGLNLLNGNTGQGLRMQGGFGVDGSILAGVGGAIGTGTFGSANTFATGSGIFEIASGDFNGDGYIDLATANYSSANINILLGTGNGSFSQSVSYALSANALSVVAGDFNGDGILDLASSSYSAGPGGHVETFLGIGNGSFSRGRSIALIAQLTDLEVGDINGDGISDILAADYGIGSVHTFLGTAGGLAATNTLFSASGVRPKSLKLGDLNNDGISDLVLADVQDDQIAILLGSANGSFGVAISLAAGSGADNLEFGDLNGDGNLDIVTGDGSNVGIFLGNGTGVFGNAQTYALNMGYSDTTTKTTSLKIADLNSDGMLDVIGTSTTNLNVAIGRGNGTFTATVSYSGTGAIEVADFNGDGVLDVASGSGDVSVKLASTLDGANRLLSFDLTSKYGARQALPVFDQKIQALGKQRGQIGAFQSRVQVGINNLQTASENYAAAESRIKDADIAAESAQLVRLNILQQAASSVLGQANLQPQLSLRLLQ